jgi:uncharacterized protein with PQ loop repeat
MMINIIGYIAMACLIVAASPQVLKSIREGHSDGIAGGFIVLLLIGFILMASYLLLTKPVIPLLINYAFNTVMMLTIGYYKLFPKNKG